MASICDVLMVESLLGVDPTQSYGENTKSSIQDFIDFAMKTHWKLIVFTNSLQVSVIFTYYCLILLYFHDFELKQRKQI